VEERRHRAEAAAETAALRGETATGD
jgi:hypothetical protein